MSTFPETLVARVTGIQKKRVADARRSAALEKGADWLLENSCVVYTADGLKKICAALGVDAGALQWPAPGAAEPPPSDEGPEEREGSACAVDPAARESAPSVAFVVSPVADHAQKIPSAPPAGPAAPAGAPAAVGLPGPEIEVHLAAAHVAEGVGQLQAAAELLEIVVTRLAPNPRVVFGKLEGRPVIVGVRDNKNFKPGMRLKAHHAGGDYYRHFGNCPRWPGRW